MNDLLKLILNEFKLVFKKKKHVLPSIFLYRRRFVRRRLNLKAKIGHRVRTKGVDRRYAVMLRDLFVGAIMV